MYNCGAESSVTCPTTLDRTPCGPNASGLSALSSKPLCHAPCCWSVDGLDMLISHKKPKDVWQQPTGNQIACSHLWDCETNLNLLLLSGRKAAVHCKSTSWQRIQSVKGSECSYLGWASVARRIKIPCEYCTTSRMSLLSLMPTKNGSELAWSVTFPLDGVPEAAKNKTKSASFYISWPNSTPELSLWEESWWGCSVMVA